MLGACEARSDIRLFARVMMIKRDVPQAAEYEVSTQVALESECKQQWKGSVRVGYLEMMWREEATTRGFHRQWLGRFLPQGHLPIAAMPRSADIRPCMYNPNGVTMYLLRGI